MIGAIIGDIIGSRFERFNYKGKDFELFHESCRMTDDSILTLAVADAFMNGKSYCDIVLEYARENPLAGYGGSFVNWVDSSDHKPYNSWGNGSAMRVSALSWLIDDMDILMEEAKKSAEITHNHPEGIKGAQAIAAAVLLARQEKTKEEIKQYIEDNFKYDLNRTVKFLNETYQFDVSCQGSVPEAIICFLESTDFEDCLRNAISIGGDSDTIASMSCAIAEAYYIHIDEDIQKYALDFVLKNQRFSNVFNQFNETIVLNNL